MSLRILLTLLILTLITGGMTALPDAASAETANERKARLDRKMDAIARENAAADRERESKEREEKREADQAAKENEKELDADEEAPRTTAERATVYCSGGKVIFPKNPTAAQKKQCAK